MQFQDQPYRAFGLAHRRNDMSQQDFADYWRHPHGSMGPYVRALAGYVQNHVLPGRGLGLDEVPWHGIPQMEFDALEGLRDFRRDKVVTEYFAPDEPNFINLDRSAFLAMRLTRRQDFDLDGPRQSAALDYRPTSVKIIQLVAAKQQPLPWTDFIDHASALGVSRATESVRCSEIPFGSDAFDHLRELSWPTYNALAHCVAAEPENWTALTCRSRAAHSIVVQAERWRLPHRPAD